MKQKASGFYADSLEMLLDTMCNVLGMVIFITLTLAQLVRQSNASSRPPSAQDLSNQLTVVAATNAIVEAQLKELALKLQETHEARTNLMSLPNLSRTVRQPWLIIISGGQLYPVNRLAPESRTGLAHNDRTLGWPGGGEVRPIPAQGDDATKGVERIIQSFRANSKTNYYLDFYVYEDSFDAFNQAKETTVKLGFQYNWEPQPLNARIFVTQSARSPSRVQN